MFELFGIIRELRRSRRLVPEMIATIEAEGGEVLEHRPISRLVPSLFPGFRVSPNLYEFRARYGPRRGRWYVRTSGDKLFPDWAWADDNGNETPIVERPHLVAKPDWSAFEKLIHRL